MTPIDIDLPTPLLGGLSPRRFMRRHWQKKPLLVRQALSMARPFVTRAELFALAGRDDVESRLVEHAADGTWQLRHGPFARRALPALRRPRWSLLVQGLDLHLDAAHALLQRFRFVPDARLDDVMVSYASDGGGVGPHFDSYDVFLLQIHGRRRWRIGRLRNPQLQPDVPLRILAHLQPEQEWLLEPGDMLYLPPRWAHDGIAEGECSTCSIGFRAPARDELGRALLQRLLDAPHDERGDGLHDGRRGAALYRDADQPATRHPARLPEALHDYAADAVARLQREPDWLARCLGEVLSEPKPDVWFDAGSDPDTGSGVRLDRRTRMVYDARHVYINGESYRAGGRDATLMRRLADRRVLGAADVARLGADARVLLDEWASAGWLVGGDAAG
jgi:50S ribosomal protein L16 3-hydroxylase